MEASNTTAIELKQAVTPEPGPWPDSQRLPSFDAVTRAVPGFGPTGAYTLQLPVPGDSKTVGVLDGKCVIETLQAWQPPTNVATLRQELVDLIVRVASGDGVALLPNVLPLLMDLAASIIECVYIFTDDDLELLLNGGSWHSAVLQFASMSPDLVKCVNVAVAREVPIAPPAPAVTAPPTRIPPRKRSLLKRLIRRK